MTSVSRADHLLVVGASLAGIRAAEAARSAGYRGRITLLGNESSLPYDRPSLSKGFLDLQGSVDPVYLTSADALSAAGIDAALGETAQWLDPDRKVVGTDIAEHRYSTLILATGSSAITVPGMTELAGAHVLRTVEDAIAVRSALDAGARTVVVGGGFVGAEVASAARKRGLPVTVIEAAQVPLVRAVGESMGFALSSLHEQHGTDLKCRASVASIEGCGTVEAVVLDNGQRIAADLVIFGIGSRPNTEWLEQSLKTGDGIVCDRYLRTSATDVFAAGDVARWQNDLFGTQMRVEHFTAAAEQGAWAGRNAVGGGLTPYATVPYFWSDWYGQRIQFVGVVTEDVHVVAGDTGASQFVALYRAGDRVVGALTLNGQRYIMKYRRMIAESANYDDAVALVGVELAGRAR